MTINFNSFNRPPIQAVYDAPSNPGGWKPSPAPWNPWTPKPPQGPPMQLVYDAPSNPGGWQPTPAPWNPWTPQPTPWMPQPFPDGENPWNPGEWAITPLPWENPNQPPIQAIYDAPNLPWMQQNQWFS